MERIQAWCRHGGHQWSRRQTRNGEMGQMNTVRILRRALLCVFSCRMRLIIFYGINSRHDGYVTKNYESCTQKTRTMYKCPRITVLMSPKGIIVTHRVILKKHFSKTLKPDDHYLHSCIESSELWLLNGSPDNREKEFKFFFRFFGFCVMQSTFIAQRESHPSNWFVTHHVQMSISFMSIVVMLFYFLRLIIMACSVQWYEGHWLCIQLLYIFCNLRSVCLHLWYGIEINNNPKICFFFMGWL